MTTSLLTFQDSTLFGWAQKVFKNALCADFDPIEILSKRGAFSDPLTGLLQALTRFNSSFSLLKKGADRGEDNIRSIIRTD